MASSAGTVQYLMDQLHGAGEVRTRKMFGEYCLYFADKPVGLICDDQLFIKPTDPGRALISELQEGFPFPGARPYFLIEADLWEEREWLAQLVQVTAMALPPPKPKKAGRKKRPGPAE